MLKISCYFAKKQHSKLFQAKKSALKQQIKIILKIPLMTSGIMELWEENT
jgi:hypothetical protein